MGRFSEEAGREALHGHQRLPEWITRERARLSELHAMKKGLRERGLHTVCEEARCPNRGRCFGQGAAAFLLMGSVCTRDCGFCSVASGAPKPTDPTEPIKTAMQVSALRLRYAVLTSVTRDDLADGGAAHFALTVKAVKEKGAKVEVLVPDFQGDIEAVARVVAAGPAVFNHNLETVPDLYPSVRSKANYGRSLNVLVEAKRIGGAIFGDDFLTKSGLMLGLGETEDQLTQVFGDLVGAGVDILTLGQYLRPTRRQLPVREYIHPDEFDRLGEKARGMGFRTVFSGPLVRSSFNAEEAFGEALRPMVGR